MCVGNFQFTDNKACRGFKYEGAHAAPFLCLMFGDWLAGFSDLRAENIGVMGLVSGHNLGFCEYVVKSPSFSKRGNNPYALSLLR